MGGGGSGSWSDRHRLFGRIGADGGSRRLGVDDDRSCSGWIGFVGFDGARPSGCLLTVHAQPRTLELPRSRADSKRRLRVPNQRN